MQDEVEVSTEEFQLRSYLHNSKVCGLKLVEARRLLKALDAWAIIMTKLAFSIEQHCGPTGLFEMPTDRVTIRMIFSVVWLMS